MQRPQSLIENFTEIPYNEKGYKEQTAERTGEKQGDRDMQKHLIFLDIDGTIVNERTGVITQGTIDAVCQARKQGHEVFINTGRSKAEVSQKVLDINVDGVVCGCGTYIEYHGQELLRKSFGTGLSKQIMEDVRKYKIDAILEGTPYIYADKKVMNPYITKLHDYFGQEVVGRILSFDDKEINFDKLSMWITPESDFYSFEEKYKNSLTFIDRGTNFVEVIPSNYSKASGIQFLMDYLKVPLEYTMAIGDSPNDLSMLEFVGISVAMGNSSPDLFHKVKFVTKSIEEDGIQYALAHYGLI